MSAIAATGREKTAVLLLTMGPEFASAALKSMSEDRMMEVLKCMGRSKVIDRGQQAVVLEEFCRKCEGELGNIVVEPEGIGRLVEDAMGRVEGRRILNSLIEDDGFKEIQKASLPSLAGLLAEEHPQTAALVLTRLAADKSAGILAGLPEGMQAEVCRRIGHMRAVPKEVLGEVGRALTRSLKKRPGAQVEAGPVGMELLSSMLSMAGPGVSKSVLDSISRKEPGMAEKISSGMVAFEDILRLDAQSVQKLLGKVDQKSLTNALKGGAQNISEKIFANVTKEASEALIEDMETMGEVKGADAEAARQKFIVEMIVLLKSGEITMSKEKQGND